MKDTSKIIPSFPSILIPYEILTDVIECTIRIIGCVIEERPIEDITVAEKGNFTSNITLYDCLKIYTKEEKVCNIKSLTIPVGVICSNFGFIPLAL